MVLRFVALYTLIDAVNIVLLGALQGAGDTRWTLLATTLLYGGFFLALQWCDAAGADLYTIWTVATGFLFIQAAVWILRFRSGRWRHIRVIERIDEERADEPHA